jgi:hypothetical protein
MRSIERTAESSCSLACSTAAAAAVDSPSCRYGCGARRSKGTCNNNATVSRQEIEARVLEGLKERLMAPELVREFIRAFQEEANATAAELEQAGSGVVRR